ncbi:hypothetical protein ACH4U3_32460 [Streptomyces griseoruber]|uniref:hypothetical protein n=1 Tax=Streptomyces griseoruber TaxID=1943 RepID=UPI0037A6C7F9
MSGRFSTHWIKRHAIELCKSLTREKRIERDHGSATVTILQALVMPRGCVEETAVAPAGRERGALTAGVEVLPAIIQDWQIYFVARYMLDA